MKFFCNKEHTNDTFWHRKFGVPVGSIIVLILEFVQVVVIAAAIIIPIRYFLAQPFYVKGASMEPNFYDREYLIINEIGYRLSEPARGDIVVFHYPKDESEYFIKRIIGLPGETVEIDGGRVVIYNNDHPNGLALDESEYLPEGTITIRGRYNKVTLSENEYYVLGDHRDASSDSRAWGAVNRSEIVGEVWLRGLPVNRLSTFSNPNYNL
jgi:signal peptidase I